MRACVLTATGGLAHVTVTQVPDPGPPGPGQVRIAVQAAALNHLDLFVAQGLPGTDYRFPHIMGADGAGLVDAVGAGVTGARPGERVRTETVLVWGIGGGVSLAAMRIAKLLGAKTIVTSSSDAKLQAAHRLGADVTLNHRTQNVAQEVRALTGKRGVEVVVENVGEATWDSSLRALAPGGRLVTCGATSGPKVSIDLRRLFWYHWTLMGSTMGNLAEYAEVVRRLGRGELRPVVDRVYPLAEARAALERLEQAEQLGKIAVEI